MIKSLKAVQILDSKLRPTIKVALKTDKGVFSASVPSGTSEGKYEAAEVRAEKAVENVNKIIGPELIAKDFKNQEDIDNFLIKLDGTNNKSRLGANAILAVSIAFCRACATDRNLSLWQYIKLYRDPVSVKLPVPCVLLIEGGMHAKNNQSKLDFQEFLFLGNFDLSKKIYKKLGKILNCGKGDEGGFSPQISDAKQALNYIMEAAEGEKVQLGLDCAASSFSQGKYQMDFYSDLVKNYPIIYLEDPFKEDDWQSFQEITQKLGKKIIIVGDDLTATNPERIKIAREKQLINAVIIKPDQIGTVAESIEAARLAKSYGWKVIVSHRSGETIDDFIADLAVGVGADFIKSGAPGPKERMSKYNRLLEIEKEIK